MTEARTTAVAEACAGCADTEGLQAALVFGSALCSEHPNDLDVALLWSESLSTVERWRRANRLAAEIERRLPAPRLAVDVKDLRSLSLPLQYRVLREGVEAFVADRRALVRFASLVLPQALDFLPRYYGMLRASARRLARVGS